MTNITIITIISIIALAVLITWKSIKNSKAIACNVYSNIENEKKKNKNKTRNDKLISEIRIKFLEAQKNGIDRITYINEIRKELEKQIRYEEDDEQPTWI